MHITILKEGQVDLQKCQKCCTGFHCPFCKESVFRPVKDRHVVDHHVHNHIASALKHDNYRIVKCNLQCRDQAHFHCVYCNTTVIRRVQIVKHLEACKQVSISPTAPIHAPINVYVQPLPETQLSNLSRVQKTVRCTHCGLTLNKKNLRLHIQRKHSAKVTEVTGSHHLPSQCIDPVNGIYAVEKSFRRPCSVVHVQKRSGPQPAFMCESDECASNLDFAARSGLENFECMHLKSLQFCSRADRDPAALEEDLLTAMVEERVFGEQTKVNCLARKTMAAVEGVPLSVVLNIGGPSSKVLISIFEPKVAYWSRLGRVTVGYNSSTSTWHCPCAKPRASCLHKGIAKWHVFQEHRELLTSSPTHHPVPSETPPQNRTTYPPSGEGLKRMVEYLLENKKLPAKLPTGVMHPVMTHERHLIPTETHCSLCQCDLSGPVLITSKARLVTYTGIIEGFSTYYRLCQCGQYYRYQEWTAGMHNFDDHLLISLHLCMILRNSLQTHHAVSRVIEVLESTTGQTFPRKARILHAYMHFEALTSHDYSYSCIKCGYHPAVVVMDLHRKTVFNMPTSDIPDPPAEYDGHVNITDFWTMVMSEVVCQGLLRSGCKNPFLVQPTYHFWAPWIGPNTRRGDSVFNTEHAKIHAPRQSCETAELLITEERLEEALTTLKVDVVRRLCQQCGLDSVGSKMDMVLRLRQEMRNRSTYDKVFQKVWGASGGWAVITCPCGIVYGVKFLLRAESPRDYADCLLSFCHFPNIAIYDFARGLASHTNLREPESVPFRPYEGRLKEPTQENIKLGLDGHLKVNLPWLKERRNTADPDCHPVTGSAEHYALYDIFHEKNTKDTRDVLRRIEIVPELAGWVNSQTCEQLFSDMKKNNYFLNSHTPSGHAFLMRNILHHHNSRKNYQFESSIKKIVPPNVALELDEIGRLVRGRTQAATPTACDATPVPSDALELDEIGRLVRGRTQAATPTACDATPVPSDAPPSASDTTQTAAITPIASDVTSVRRTMQAERELEEFRIRADLPILYDVLDRTKPFEEAVGLVGTTVLTRSDCIALGRDWPLEATVVNCCFSLICDFARERGLDVFCVDAYALASWSKPLSADPFDSLPADAAMKDCILFPAWTPGHWHLCVMKPNIKRMYILDPSDPSGFGPHADMFSAIAVRLAPGTWQLVKNKDVPGQRDSLDCGVFILMYALYNTFGWRYDFSQNEMPYIRGCWQNLLLMNMKPKRTSAEELYHPSFSREIDMLPASLLEDILIEVVLHEGDRAILTLALVCANFRVIVTREAFRRRAHFLWLNSVANWQSFSASYKSTYFRMYELDTCRHCCDQYKNCCPGYVGRGKRGELFGSMSEDTHPEYCSEFCQICAAEDISFV